MKRSMNLPFMAFSGVICIALVLALALMAAPAQAAPEMTGNKPPEPKCAEGQITISPAQWVEEVCTAGAWSTWSPGGCPAGSDESGNDATCDDQNVEQFRTRVGTGPWSGWQIGACPAGSDESGSDRNCEDEDREAFRTRTVTCTEAHWTDPVCQNPSTVTSTPTEEPKKVTFHHCDQGFPGNDGCVEHDYDPAHAPTGWILGPCPEVPACFPPTSTSAPTNTQTPEPTNTLTSEPTYTPEATPTGPAPVCEDETANNVGEPLPCKYDDPPVCEPEDYNGEEEGCGTPPGDGEEEVTGKDICDRALIFYDVCFPEGGGEPGLVGKLLLWIQSW